MRNAKLWNKWACIVMTVVIAGSVLTGCRSYNKESEAVTDLTAETAAGEGADTAVKTDTSQKDAESDAAADTEAPASEAAGDAAVGAATASTTAPTEDSQDTVRGGTLAPFVYVGNAEEGKICTAQAYAYARGDRDLDGGDVVVIPAYVIADETENDGSLQLLANIWVYLFELDGTTLRLTAGGSYPCRIQAAGGEITSVETAYTDEDTLTLCGGDESLVQILHDDDALHTSLRNNVGMYVNNYGYNIDTYEIGSETFAINAQ